MKYATFSKSAFAVTAILALALSPACANSADVPATEAAPTEPPPSATVPPAKATPPAEKKCAPSCKTDSDCQTSCPNLPSGVQCCDTQSGSCRGVKGASCPAPQADAGTNPTPAGY